MVKAKMQQEGIDSSFIDKSPDDMIPLKEESADDKKVAASEHPLYSKYFKMLKVLIIYTK